MRDSTATLTEHKFQANGDVTLGSVTDPTKRFAVVSGATWSGVNAGDGTWSTSSSPSLKEAIAPLPPDRIQRLREVLRDSVVVSNYHWKRSSRYDQEAATRMVADTLLIPKRVTRELDARRELGKHRVLVRVDSTDTTWTTKPGTVSLADSAAVADSVSYHVRARVLSGLAGLEEAAQHDAAVGRVGIMATDAYRISRIVAPDEARPDELNGHHVQMALVTLVQDLIRENDRQAAQIADLTKRVEALEQR